MYPNVLGALKNDKKRKDKKIALKKKPEHTPT